MERPLSGSDFTHAPTLRHQQPVSRRGHRVGLVGKHERHCASLASPVLLTGTGTTKILEAEIGEGAGVYDVSIVGTLNIPGGTLVGTYKSIVRVEIASGP